MEFAGGLDSGLSWGRLTVLFVSPATDVLQLITLWAEVRSRSVHVNIIQLSSVVSAVHKFDFRLVIQETP